MRCAHSLTQSADRLSCSKHVCDNFAAAASHTIARCILRPSAATGRTDCAQCTIDDDDAVAVAYATSKGMPSIAHTHHIASHRSRACRHCVYLRSVLASIALVGSAHSHSSRRGRSIVPWPRNQPAASSSSRHQRAQSGSAKHDVRMLLAMYA